MAAADRPEVRGRESDRGPRRTARRLVNVDPVIAKLHLYLVDVTAALVLWVIVLYGILEAYDHPSYWVAVPAAALIAVPVAVRRRWPEVTLAVITAAMVVAVISQVLPMHALGAPVAAICFGLYTVAVERPRAWSLAALAVTVVAISGITGGEPGNVLVSLAAMGAVWVMGYTTRLRRAMLARETSQQAGKALTDERLRIARELHDVVAHNLSLIAVQAGNAAHVRSPEHAYQALEVISETSRAALTEMRGLLGVLRSDADLTPSPGLGGLAELAGRASLAGVRVSLDVRGDTAVPEGVGLSVYRIVQEAVTNTLKHAHASTVDVRVRYLARELEVDVADDGRGGPADSSGGLGLIGMRERVAVHDGTVEAGPRPGGGFRVRARLPLALVEQT
jgi:signal transduction histidine kinase